MDVDPWCVYLILPSICLLLQLVVMHLPKYLTTRAKKSIDKQSTIVKIVKAWYE